eukprot:TRINITY_DN9061_c0_g1_i1.p1 TRINITY_DN9061_c0_g1~~TRINITY_DN9061_c0_g1_i1.p1  ORF type:complete len:1150 (+),score=199.70 TRINITY_DN9061_c0_g1_i1:174-3623(+)
MLDSEAADFRQKSTFDPEDADDPEAGGTQGDAEEGKEDADNEEPTDGRCVRCRHCTRRCKRLAVHCCRRFLQLARHAWRLSFVFLRLFGWAIVQVVCRHRLRKAALARNEWIHFRPRDERLDELKVKEVEKRAQLQKIWRGQNLSRRSILLRTLARNIGELRQSLIDSFWECVGGRDRMTGLPNDLLARWRLLHVLGEGPHGKVFKACPNQEGDAAKLEATLPKEDFVAIRIRDKAMGHVVRMELGRASRLLRNEILQGSLVVRLIRKLLALLRLSRTKIEEEGLVKLFDIRNSGEWFIEVMEYLPGGSLYHYLEKHELLDEYTVCHIAQRLCGSLAHLHSRGLVHRDVRLGQIVLAEVDTPESAKLADLWGLQRLSKKGEHIEEGRPCDIGSTAPEVLLSGLYSQKSDVWSAGCAIFELLHGHPPFGGRGEALVQRICTQKPEFSVLGTGKEGISDLAHDLLNLMLHRNPAHRPSMNTCLQHEWFQEYGGKKPAKKLWVQPFLIRRVALSGKHPLCRRGLPASNLLNTRPGTMNAGFCTFMGSTAVDIDFEILGKGDHAEYWVSHCVLALWGREENPRTVTVRACVRRGAPWADVGHVEVETINQSEARLEIDKPVHFVRISLRGNFGGSFGIAVQKVSFYGYECRQLPITIDLDTSKYSRGSDVYMHSQDINPKDVKHSVHPSIVPSLRSGHRIEGTHLRYKTYEDICSGAPHITTAVETQRLKLPRDVILIGAVFGLRYFSSVPSKDAAAPRIRLQLIEEVEVEDAKGREHKAYKKRCLFATQDLPPPEWDVSGVLKNGYMDYPIMFANNLDLSTDGKHSLEVLFENFAGTCHVPSDLGLFFYYIPELATPSSDGGEGAEEALAEKMKGARRGGIVNADGLGDAFSSNLAAAGGPDSKAMEDAKMLGMDLAASDAGDSDVQEAELAVEYEKQEQALFFGSGGPALKAPSDAEPFRPVETLVHDHLDAWWRDVMDEASSGTGFSDMDSDGGKEAKDARGSDEEDFAEDDEAHEEGKDEAEEDPEKAGRRLSVGGQANAAARRAETAVEAAQQILSKLRQEAAAVATNRQTVRLARKDKLQAVEGADAISPIQRRGLPSSRQQDQEANNGFTWIPDVASTCGVELPCSRVTKATRVSSASYSPPPRGR